MSVPFKKLYPHINNKTDDITNIAVFISLDSFNVISFLQMYNKSTYFFFKAS